MQNPKSPNVITSSEIVASNDDLLTEILLILPIKPLMRFKSVSKHWLSLITDHTFCLRRNPIPNPPTGLFLSFKDDNQYIYKYISLYPETNPNPPPFNLNFATDPSKTEIIHSCNGLFLCCSSETWNGKRYVIHSRDCSIYVYNPTTNCSTTILDSTFKWNYLHGATLVFDPNVSPHYKVVLVMFVFSSPEDTLGLCEIRVYLSETRRWTHGGGGGVRVDEGRVGDVCRNGVYWNGSVNWLCCELNVGGSEKSMRFDVEMGVLAEMPSPPVRREYKWDGYYYFGVSCDHLQFVEHLLPVLNVYEMKRDYSEWFVKYRVDVTRIVDAFPEVVRVSFWGQSYVSFVLSLVRREDDDKELGIVLRIPGKVVKYNLVGGTSEKLCDCEHERIDQKIVLLGGDDDEPVETYEFRDEYGLDYIPSIYSC